MTPPDLPEVVRGDDLCARAGCGHFRDAHRLDDSLNISPDDPAAPFRCVGYPMSGRDEAPVKWIDTECDCPDWEEPT